MGYSSIEVEVRKPVGWIYFNRPDKLNAMNTSLLREAVEALDSLESEPEVHFIVLSGRGRAFSAGIDLSEVAGSPSPESAGRIFEVLARFFRRLLTVEAVTIAAVNGHAVGGGAEVLWAVDLSVAVKGAKIAWPEARWGLVPPALSTIGPAAIGPARAGYLALTSGGITAEEAHRIGLVSRLVDNPEELEKAVEEMVNEVMKNSRDSAYSISRMLRTAKTTPILELGISELARLARSSDVISASKGFVERREQPRWEW